MKPYSRRLTLCAALATASLSAMPSMADLAPSLAEQIRDDIVVSAARVEIPRSRIGSSVSVLSSSDIDIRKPDVADGLLREVPGVSVNRSGPVGGLTQLRIRGAEGNHTLVLIDGIEANDPAFSSEFDLANLTAHDLSRIEVLRGPQSALYGSDAIGGVINVFTPETTRGYLQASGGSFGTVNISGAVGIGGEQSGLRVSAQHFDTDGVDASTVGSEEDGFQSHTVHAKGWQRFGDNGRIELVVRRTETDVDTDIQDFAFPATATQGLIIDANNATESERLYARLGGRWTNDSGTLSHTANLGYTDTDTDLIAAGNLDGGNAAERLKADYQATWRIDRGGWLHQLSAGLQHERLDFTNRSSSLPAANYSEDDDQTSLVAEWLGGSERFDLGLSARFDNNDRFDDATTLRAMASWQVSPSTRLRASIGQGVTNPSFFELFGFIPSSFIGNPNLQPEASISTEIGIEQSFWDGRALLDIVLFQADLTDEILTVFDFDPVLGFVSSPVNGNDDSERQGIEVALRAAITDSIDLRAQATWLDAEDPNGDEEARRPQLTASATLTARFASDRASLALSVLHNGESEDNEFIFSTAADRVTLDSYTLLNLALTVDLNERVSVFVRSDNLLDEEIEEVFSYNSPGAAGYAGVRVHF